MDREVEIGQAIVDALAATEAEKTPLDLVEEIPILEATIETVVASRIDAARAQGLSWEAIAQRLGISRQAAHKRFGRARTKKAHKGKKSRQDGLRLELRVKKD